MNDGNDHHVKEEKRPSLKNKKLLIQEETIKIDKSNKDKSIKWDLTEAENYLHSSEHSQMKKAFDPKTPYVEIEETDDVYLNKLKEVNKINPSKDLLEEVCKKIEEHNHQVEAEEKRKQDFDEKRKKIYTNEFAMAKDFQKNVDNDEELIEETMRNTLYNRYIGKLSCDKTNDQEQFNDNK